MFLKKPSIDESPLQELSEDQMNQVAGGMDCSSSDSWNWKHRHHHHHHHWHRRTTPVKVEVIVIEKGSNSSWHNNSDGYSGGRHW